MIEQLPVEALDLRVLQSRLIPEAVLRRLAYHPRAARAVRYAQERIKALPSLTEIAAEAGMNPSAFSRYFREKVGISFFSLLRMLRMERAIEELERADCSISFLAACAGYDNTCSFSRAFKLVTGKTPSEFRAAIALMPD